jgi:hypothetical protein
MHFSLLIFQESLYANFMASVYLSKSIIIQTPQATVFAAITNWDNQSGWMIGTKVHATTLDGRAIGGQLEARTTIGRVGFLDTMTITAWQPPDRCSVTHTGSVVRGSGDFIVRKLAPNASEFVWAEQIDLPFGPIGKISWYFLRPFAVFGIIISLRRFKRWVEKQSHSD